MTHELYMKAVTLVRVACLEKCNFSKTSIKRLSLMKLQLFEHVDLENRNNQDS